MIAGSWLYLIQRGVAEVKDMAPWPGPDVRPEQILEVDLSHLGLDAGQIKNAPDEES